MNNEAHTAPGNWSEVRASKWEGQRWNSTLCRFPTIRPRNILVNQRTKLNFAENAPPIGIELKTNVLMKAIHFGPNYIDNFTGTQSSRNVRFYSISRIVDVGPSS